MKRVFARLLIAPIAFIVGYFFAVMMRFDPPPVAAYPVAEYDGAPIILPIEAFGATWRVQRFRKNVRFPTGEVDEAFDRAFSAAKALRTVTSAEIEVRLRPVTYRTSRGITFPSGLGRITINGNSAVLEAR